MKLYHGEIFGIKKRQAKDLSLHIDARNSKDLKRFAKEAIENFCDESWDGFELRNVTIQIETSKKIRNIKL